jgi:nucleotide-binding universal stress UspA family protein
MTTPRSLLVAVDFGEASARAVEAAGVIATRCRADALQVLHAEAIEAPPYFTAAQVESLEQQRQAIAAQAQRYLSEFVRRHTAAPFAATIVTMPPVEAILHEATAVDLVVMGTHGRHGPKRWWLGSVAERVLRSVARPLLIMRAEVVHPVGALFDRVVVHAGAPLRGAATLQYTEALVGCFGGKVFDRRHGLIEPAIQEADATLLVVAAAEPRTTQWLADYGEPLVRFSPVPILFVPESSQGAPS